MQDCTHGNDSIDASLLPRLLADAEEIRLSRIVRYYDDKREQQVFLDSRLLIVCKTGSKLEMK